ncbi:IS110 family transposase [Streptomyces sp. NPDC055808]|uniref:IS110 family transposase n=1 Tax=Streptomyces sp. NPDC001828 TaxID=3364615 RepID=UPI0036910419
MVLGVDTHRDVHVAAVIVMTGKTLAVERFPATAADYRQLVQWASRLGAVRRAGVEGSGSYGRGPVPVPAVARYRCHGGRPWTGASGQVLTDQDRQGRCRSGRPCRAQ